MNINNTEKYKIKEMLTPHTLIAYWYNYDKDKHIPIGRIIDKRSENTTSEKSIFKYYSDKHGKYIPAQGEIYPYPKKKKMIKKRDGNTQFKCKDEIEDPYWKLLKRVNSIWTQHDLENNKIWKTLANEFGITKKTKNAKQIIAGCAKGHCQSLITLAAYTRLWKDNDLCYFTTQPCLSPNFTNVNSFQMTYPINNFHTYTKDITTDLSTHKIHVDFNIWDDETYDGTFQIHSLNFNKPRTIGYITNGLARECIVHAARAQFDITYGLQTTQTIYNKKIAWIYINAIKYTTKTKKE